MANKITSRFDVCKLGPVLHLVFIASFPSYRDTHLPRTYERLLTGDQARGKKGEKCVTC